MKNLIKLNCEQVERSEFPTGCPVYICNEHAPYIESHGKVVGVFLQMGSVLQMFCTIRNGKQDNIVPNERLRFRNDCPVYLTQDGKKSKGIILGFCEIPKTDKRRNSSDDKYWYSIFLCESKVLVHEVTPGLVSYREIKKNAVGAPIPKEVMISEAGDISVLPSVLELPPGITVVDLSCVKEEPKDHAVEDDVVSPIENENSNHNNNTILVNTDGQKNTEDEGNANDEFNNNDDDFSDYSSSSSIVEIPMPDIFSVEGEIANHEKEKLSTTNDQSSTISWKSSIDRIANDESVPLTLDDENENSTCANTESDAVDAITYNEAVSISSDIEQNNASGVNTKTSSGKKRTFSKISNNRERDTDALTIDLSGDICDSSDDQINKDNYVRKNTDINSFKICRRVKVVGQRMSLVDSMLNEKKKKWRTVGPKRTDERYKELEGKTYYWCSKCKNLKGSWALHHEEDHKVDDPDYHILHWTEKCPSSGQLQTRREGEFFYNWCKECRNGKGQWTILHKPGEHWKCVPPSLNGRLSKNKGCTNFYWCKKCKNGRGMWSIHSELEHRDNRVGKQNQRIDNPNYWIDRFSEFVKDGDIVSSLKCQMKTVPLSCWTSETMCVSYHVKGYCVNTCKRAKDHHDLAFDEAKRLIEWCLKSRDSCKGDDTSEKPLHVRTISFPDVKLTVLKGMW